MDRRKFLHSMSVATAASIAGAGTLSAKADILEEEMARQLEKRRAKPGLCLIDGRPERVPGDNRVGLMGADPLLPRMPEKPTLADFFHHRFGSASHLLQSAKLAMDSGENDKVVLACLLHDISVYGLLRTDHGYWGAQLIGPYVDEEVRWAIEKHQALRFFADRDFDYEYPEAYIRYFGADYKPEPYIVHEHKEAKKHKWYKTSRLITVNDLYSFEEGVEVEIEDFSDVIGRAFKTPKEGLGFDGSATAHMWRTMIWPNNFL
jgi:hypothetical protein